jgi:molecular chaperone GrpE (heat shock protein)
MSDQEILNKRNIEALNTAAAQDRERVQKLLIELQTLKTQYLKVLQDMTALKQQVMLFIATRGSGPTGGG